ncbi:hypothetical protein BUALT_Bualt06G0011500 [Buddleja alternifolia]|uniref:C2 domain-containing protein n=1 Tax=Buddleja alternifolia TaxID=168488 RepID=A0AAV6XIP5_9LAMI|nr:hypothetical protein BUALT_Bualt06G0011500 [Buddleja alternifolia]
MSRVPYHLLELNLISAQDLSPVSKNLKTYGVVWVNPDRKLRTRIDHQGQTNPIWNEKFVFRVDEAFLNSDTSFVMIEIYAIGWLRDTPVGSVRVFISNLIPPSVRRENGSSHRFVALQTRRSSGRPQGILNMGVSLLDNTMHSMPLLTTKNKKKIQLWRSLSDQTDLTRKPGGDKKKKTGSVCDAGPIVNYDQGFTAKAAGGGSVVNGGCGGSVVNGSVCNSDVGPSPSVVAAAVACGLYPTQLGPPPAPGSSVLEDWKVEESSVEGLKTKIERWRMESPQVYDQKRFEKVNGRGKKRAAPHRRRKTVDNVGGGGGGPFSCFGNACGCEFTIVCGSNGVRKSRSRGYT